MVSDERKRELINEFWLHTLTRSSDEPAVVGWDNETGGSPEYYAIFLKERDFVTGYAGQIGDLIEMFLRGHEPAEVRTDYGHMPSFQALDYIRHRTNP